MTNQPAVYILASKRNGTLYIGVTSDLQKRTWEHKSNVIEGFTKKYGVHQLVYYELYGDMLSAITREKQMKKWNRAWKLEVIEKQNPDWKDLWDDIIEKEGKPGFPKFTNEVQHFLYKVLQWDDTMDNFRLKNAARFPNLAKLGKQSAKSRQLWIARHRL